MLLWALSEPGRLSERARHDIAERAEQVLVSPVSIWEASIKRAIGRLELPADFVELIAQAGFDELPVRFAHGLAAGGLPHHHRDPFDRMLIAQAQIERLTLATADSDIAGYDVTTLDVTQN